MLIITTSLAPATLFLVVVGEEFQIEFYSFEAKINFKIQWLLLCLTTWNVAQEIQKVCEIMQIIAVWSVTKILQ